MKRSTKILIMILFILFMCFLFGLITLNYTELKSILVYHHVKYGLDKINSDMIVAGTSIPLAKYFETEEDSEFLTDRSPPLDAFDEKGTQNAKGGA